MIPAMILARIESLTGKPIAELFDLIAGTSTGGILTLGLTKPGPDERPQYPAAEMVALYQQEGGRIFHRPALRKILSLGNLAEDKYPPAGIESVLRAYDSMRKADSELKFKELDRLEKARKAGKLAELVKKEMPRCGSRDEMGPPPRDAI